MQVNSIKVNKNSQSVISKDLLREETVSIGIQILHLKSLNIALPNGKDGNWAWEDGQDVSIVVSGKFVQQINPEIIEIGTAIRQGSDERRGKEVLRKAVGYGFCSDELCKLAGIIFQKLLPEDRHKIVEIKQTDSFPYQIDGELASSSTAYQCH